MSRVDTQPHAPLPPFPLQLDHHCPWTGKVSCVQRFARRPPFCHSHCVQHCVLAPRQCIGKRNLTFFYMFLGTLSLNIIYTMIILFVQLAMNRPASSASQ